MHVHQKGRETATSRIGMQAATVQIAFTQGLAFPGREDRRSHRMSRNMPLPDTYGKLCSALRFFLFNPIHPLGGELSRAAGRACNPPCDADDVVWGETEGPWWLAAAGGWMGWVSALGGRSVCTDLQHCGTKWERWGCSTCWGHGRQGDWTRRGSLSLVGSSRGKGTCSGGWLWCLILSPVWPLLPVAFRLCLVVMTCQTGGSDTSRFAWSSIFFSFLAPVPHNVRMWLTKLKNHVLDLIGFRPSCCSDNWLAGVTWPVSILTDLPPSKEGGV